MCIRDSKTCVNFFLMIRRPPRSTPLYSSAASDVYKRQVDENNRHADLSAAAVKIEDGKDPEMIAAERIARQLYRESNGPRITSKSRKKGNEICDHLIASLRNQPEQANLDF